MTAANQSTTPDDAAEIYLIIDDMGYRPTDDLAFALPTEVTFSILPHTPQGQQFAERAHAQARDVMLHLPMEAQSHKALGPGAITSSMYQDEISHTIDAALQSVPYAIGVNNHMGSQLTASGDAMQTVMNALQETGLFFVDSRTTRHTVAQQIARQYHIPNARRHVFLDHVLTDEFMNTQWQRLLSLAAKHKKVIAIAHPHPETIAFLQQKLANLPANNIALKAMSAYFEPVKVPVQRYATTAQQAIAAPN
ncbi:divergent polysaccharide deacetylase family protein [Alteromonas lipolytica]|uniref:divergent polysaccharide deacetylase family protein n=1 Tax=Alteromonas lipolytica TaxID=1856405 RepID=UPI0009F717BE|nr:divergent polysaccharide deacetylase family protein [Alteromonas lipolytica]GGF61194.1 hypothetical protein GCM10011338_11840 [Alteromonas lipolytica]